MEITVAFRSGAIINGPCLIRKRSDGPPLFTRGAGIRRANVMPILRFVPCPCGSSAHPPCMIGSRRTIHTIMVYRLLSVNVSVSPETHVVFGASVPGHNYLQLWPGLEIARRYQRAFFPRVSRIWSIAHLTRSGK